MPTYNFKDTRTGEEFERFMSMSERETFLRDNPHITQLLTSPPRLADPILCGYRAKPDHGFREVLSKIKKNNYGSTIETY